MADIKVMPLKGLLAESFSYMRGQRPRDDAFCRCAYDVSDGGF